MPETINQTFRTEKNKAENTPIMLYELTMNDSSIMRLAEWDTTIEYPTGSGYNYLPFPLSHQGISVNALGEIDSVKVRLSSVDRTIVGTLVSNNGLIGNKVVMKLVFYGHLDDADANISQTFWIDSVETDENNALFNLTSKLDLYQVTVPGRLYQRDHCQWEYKHEACWLWNGSIWVAPSGFANEGVECDHTRTGSAGCKYHSNSTRFGGFPGIPMRSVYAL